MIPYRLSPSLNASAAMTLMFCLLFAFCGAAQAQEAVTESVQKRPRPEYDPIGFELDRLFTDTAAMVKGRTASDPERPRGALSSFLVLPKIELDLTYTDNLYRARTNERADLVTVMHPTMEIKSDWDNHSLQFLASAGIGRHDRTVSEDYEDYKIGTNGVLVVGDLTSINGSVGAERGHEQRGVVDDPGANFGPTFVDSYKFSVGGEHRVPDGVLIRPYFGLSQFRHQDNGVIDNSDRWRDEYKYRLRLGYEFTPGTTLFAQPDYTSTVYRRTFDRNGLRRDTQLFEFLTGVTWDASSVTFLEAGIGFLSANFDDPTFSGETNPLARLELTWNATSLITVNTSIDRTFNPTATTGLAAMTPPSHSARCAGPATGSRSGCRSFAYPPGSTKPSPPAWKRFRWCAV